MLSTWYQFVTAEKCFVTMPGFPSYDFFLTVCGVLVIGSCRCCQGFFFTTGDFAYKVPDGPCPRRHSIRLVTKAVISQFRQTLLPKKLFRTTSASSANSAAILSR